MDERRDGLTAVALSVAGLGAERRRDGQGQQQDAAKQRQP